MYHGTLGFHGGRNSATLLTPLAGFELIVVYLVCVYVYT